MCRLFMCNKKRPLCAKSRRFYIFAVSAFFKKRNLWGWREAPQQQILLASDLPPPEKHLPRPISQKSDRALDKELAKKEDLFSCALLLLRITGMRIGELMNLEADALQKYSCTKGSLRIPLCKSLKPLLDTAAFHLEAFRRAETNTSQIKKLQRLVERLRRIALDFGKLIS